LKPRDLEQRHPRQRVAPRAGAWIETVKAQSLWPRFTVAPRAGAWIETAMLP